MDMTRMLGPGEGYEADTQQHEERGHNPLLVLHLLLQGRYMLAVVLALVFGAAAAVAGYKLTHPTFTCMGMIHIRPVISPVLFNGSGTMPMYEQYVKTQVVMLKNERCIDLAMASKVWLDNGRRSNSREAKASFINHLDVMSEGEIIRVVFTDPDADTAQTAVGVVIDAYQQISTSIEPDDMNHNLLELGDLKERYEKQLAKSQDSIATLAKPYTFAALENRYSYKVSEAEAAEMQYNLSVQAVINWDVQHGMNPKDDPIMSTARDPQPGTATQPATEGAQTDTVSSRLRADKKTDAPTSLSPADKQQAAATPVTPTKDSEGLAKASATGTVASAQKPQAATAPATKPAASQPRPRTAEEISRVDGRMRDLLDARWNAQSAMEQLMLKVGPNHPLVQAARKEVDYCDEKVNEYVANWKPLEEVGGLSQEDTSAVFLAQLREKVALDHENLVKINNEANGLGSRVSQIQDIQKSDELTVQWLSEVKQKLEEIDVSQKNPGHIWVISAGNDPEYKDKRIPMAAASAFGGGIFGFGIIIVWGLLDRRLRTIDQARMSLKQGMRVLGMLPSLPKNLEDPSAASFAALCVHHIRMLLQVMPRLDGHPAIAITSPSPGDGKTSLTMALALSYAASGKSTLLIDCDIVGAGLTRRVNAIIRRRIGQILIRENLLTAAELREALSAAQRTGRKLGEVLVDEGFVDADQLAKALAQQVETSVGLLDVMRGEVLEDCVAETGTPRLWILPIGSALAEHGATISPEGFRSVLDQARKRFDVILVDTGPIPGAIESSVATSQVDGVVLTVSRGEQGPLVKRAADHLRDIGGRALGVVFNRASPEDFSSSYSSMSNPSIPERVREKAGTDMSALGPVAAAVAGHQRSLKEGK